MRTRSFDKATDRLLRWSEREEWAQRRLEVRALHFACLGEMLEGLGLPDDALDALPGEAADMLDVFIVEDFFTAWFGEREELNVVDDYLERRGWCEQAPARRYLEALRDSVVSVYEVVGLVPGRRMTVRDLVRGGDAVTVEEKRGSQGAAMWDRLAARVVAVNAKRYFTGAVLRLRHELSRELVEAFERMAGALERDIRKDTRRQGSKAPVTRAVAREVMLRAGPVAPLVARFWLMDMVVQAHRPAPQMRNTDDEALLHCEVRFPVNGDRARVAEALDGIEELERNGEEDDEVHWRWAAQGSPLHRAARHRGRRRALQAPETVIGTTSLGYAALRKGTLVLSVNSRERAERGRELLASRLGDRVGPALIVHQDPDRAPEQQAGEVPDGPAIPTAEALRTMHAYLDEHYRRTLDEPLPVLDGKSLREAAATAKGRGRVIDWLKQLENAEHRRAARQGYRPYDTAWIWRELGIEPPRQGGAGSRCGACTAVARPGRKG